MLNALDVAIKKATVQVNGGTVKTAKDITFSVDQETATLLFDSALPLGDGLLYMEFSGELNDKMKGFYRSKYFTPSGKERYAGVTQFEATDARRCWPCWDEPAIKATFDITLNVPADRVALSNMPVISEKIQEDGWKIVKYQTSPIMSTYLVRIIFY